jgi:serine phosphatase RsbU (regulator of sigma subunit)
MINFSTLSQINNINHNDTTIAIIFYDILDNDLIDNNFIDNYANYKYYFKLREINVLRFKQDREKLQEMISLQVTIEQQTNDLKEQVKVLKMADKEQEQIIKRVAVQKKEIETAHSHIRESISYAALIQSAVLPDEKKLSKYFKDYFTIWTPKDMVGGDIYLFDELRNDDECLLMFIDCTGHGVPGAFVTMIVKAVEREVVAKIINNKDMDVSPAWIMGYFNKTLKKLLKQESKSSLSNVGWDGGVIYYNKKNKILKFAGAETPLFYIDENKEFKTVKGNRYSVGYKKCAMDYEYKETIIPVEEGMKFYCTTDGYLDQNGGTKDFPFGKKRFGNIIKDNHTKPMNELQHIFTKEMDKYVSIIPNNDRNDDVTIIAFEI